MVFDDEYMDLSVLVYRRWLFHVASRSRSLLPGLSAGIPCPSIQLLVNSLDSLGLGQGVPFNAYPHYQDIM